MKKRYLLSAAGALGAGVAGYLLKDEKNRMKMKDITSKFRNKNKGTEENSTFENAGVPDQAEDKDLSQFENSKMVSEGSQFGVQYYNEKKKENGEEAKQN